MKLLLLSLLVLSIGIPGITNVHATTGQQLDHDLWVFCMGTVGAYNEKLCGPEPHVDPYVPEPACETWGADASGQPVCVKWEEPETYSEYKCIDIDAQTNFCYTSVKPAPPNCIWVDEANRICSDYIL